ncbi:WYL domain-containing protein [Sulfurovum sp. XGS-02]|uniref:helix-turn-helix transcriptional regulator n=1 Tax=Sulfurovum sp. XGS-02 TaxID=2925411 RepID=UPI00206452A4|nr:WYL domain-containing transcriptional regulator [Sulfurovum sp. XGS-02]UPT76675.1 WYL domain-containing protein [Sulfurovum sp. XGS-02]
MEKLLQHQRHNIILERLSNGETLSITDLAKEWSIATKTVQRDFEKLQEGNYGVIRASDGKRFTLSMQHTTSKSADTAIKMLDSLSSDIGGEFYTKAQAALHKLQRYIESPFYTRIDVENISDKLDLIEDLEYAISTQKMVTFKYKRWYKPDEIKTYENVKPYKIIIFDGFWYLLTQYKDHYIKFYLKEIIDLKILEKTFEYDDKVLDRMDKALDIWFDPKTEPFDVTLLLDSDAIVYFERKPIKGQFLKKNSDGTAELTVSITNKKEIFTILKKWLPQIKVIEPMKLQEEFERILQGYLANN